MRRKGNMEEHHPYVLIVDDDPDILDNIVTVLETQPYRLATALDGKKCMEMIADEIPDLLILDLLMPRMDGWGVIREMRSEPRYTAVPIMVLTTVIEDASRRRYELETGMVMDVQDYVQKPVMPSDLIRCVERLLKERRHA
jgi:two-component system alkaline phosphatase synthesis response regulator PhoP